MTKPRQRPRYIGSRRRQASVGAGHTWFVRITKFLLLMAVLCIITAVIARLTQDPQQLKIAAIPEKDKTTPGQIDLVQPRYEGTDEKRRPYTVSADRAHRVLGEERVVALENPKGDITLEDGGWLAVKAAQGIYNNTAAKLYLSGGVTIFHDKGYEMHLKEVDIDIKTRHAQSGLPVEVQGPVGRLQAQSIDVSEQGMLIVFGGPARLTLWNLSRSKEKRG